MSTGMSGGLGNFELQTSKQQQRQRWWYLEIDLDIDAPVPDRTLEGKFITFSDKNTEKFLLNLFLLWKAVFFEIFEVRFYLGHESQERKDIRKDFKVVYIRDLCCPPWLRDHSIHTERCHATAHAVTCTG